MLRGVADVNVLVSALISRNGVCGRLLDAVFVGRWQLVVSPTLMAEFVEVSGRAKFSRIEAPEAEVFTDTLRHRALVVPDAPQPWPAVTRDPDDDYLVALAQAAGVDAIISSDAHLTDLTDVVPSVMRPADFLARVEAETEPL